MGEVFRARDTGLDRTVAIKVLNSSVVASPELRQRFEREARTISRLNHPHICTLHDVGRQDGTDFLVMEYLEGETLAQRLSKGALGLADLLKVGIAILDGLEQSPDGALELMGTHSLLRFTEQQRSHEPDRQRQVRIVEDRPGCNGELIVALCTPEQFYIRGKSDNIAGLATWALRANWPAETFQQFTATRSCTRPGKTRSATQQ